MTLSVVILAAGRGTRMNSNKPKVMHLLAGKPLLEHVIQQVKRLSPAAIYCVVGHERQVVMDALSHYPVKWVVQETMLGTGHAVLQALPQIDPHHRVLVLYGDVPLISATTLQNLLDSLEKQDLSLLTATVPDPHGLGRVVRDSVGKLLRIVEEKDATDEERLIQEINTGVLAAMPGVLGEWLPKVTAENKQNEYYLPDVVNLAIAAGRPVSSCVARTQEEVLGVNTRAQLAKAERAYQQHCAEKVMQAGVSLTDPARFDLRGELVAGEDVVIESNVLLEGHVVLGAGTMIAPNNLIKNSRIGQRVVIKANCVIEDADIGDDCVIGPFARIRPKTVLESKVHIGNFVEVKQTKVGAGSKANHLSYLGDALIGEQVNIGAGTITCNYDGVNKHQTIIEDGAFIGSNTALVAPVRVGVNATIGAGSTITKEAPDDMLTVARSRQTQVTSWKRPKKEES